MKKHKIDEIIEAKVTGLQKYGAFVNIDDDTTGLIHVSEISYGYVKNIEDFIHIGDKIFVEVKDIEDDKLKLSIKNIDYKHDGKKLKRLSETKNGFEPLKNNLENWISEKIKEITDQM